ncbi:RluA family pseudouridine synthase [Maribacter aestuarii]|uniref:RluA family pseudouridine synthase n=1 Tax=Maribacter aestuarii TaxID=1130723 RepID=UPI003221D01B
MILVNGKIGTTATHIHGEERIEYKPPNEIISSKNLDLALEVVYEDDYLAIINKTAGILVSGNRFKTVANALAQNLKKSDQSDWAAPKPVHRLDYPTTGLVLVGKTRASIVALNQLFENKLIYKTYHAVTIGKMESKGKVSLSIDGKSAISEFKVLQTLISERFGYLNLVELNPKTGRRHQLRKHLAALGNPILGDAKYNNPKLILKGKGLYLNATSLQFKHPFTEVNMHIEHELPKKFRKLFEASKASFSSKT